jgi:hypothetical protein
VFDLLESFEELKVQKNQVSKIVELTPNSFEFQMVAHAFSTTIKSNYNKNINGQNAGLFGFGPAHNKTGEITKIEKCYNPDVFDRFKGELKRCLKKYP